jgi:hypothetical protein
VSVQPFPGVHVPVPGGELRLPATAARLVRSPASVPRCGYREMPARTGASEQTWSKHGYELV